MTTEVENPENFDDGLTRVAPVEKFDLNEKREELFMRFKVGLGIRGAKPEEILLLISKIREQDKEFIRLLKEEFKLIYHQYNSGNKKGSILVCFEDLFEVIDKLAGKSLTE